MTHIAPGAALAAGACALLLSAAAAGTAAAAATPAPPAGHVHVHTPGTGGGTPGETGHGEPDGGAGHGEPGGGAGHVEHGGAGTSNTTAGEKAAVLSGFAAVNAAVVGTAFVLRRRGGRGRRPGPGRGAARGPA